MVRNALILFILAGSTTLSGCAFVADTTRGLGLLDTPMEAGPAARDGEGIILGKDDVIHVASLSSAEYSRQLTRLTREFRRETQNVIRFRPGERSLDARDRAVLAEQAKWIRSHPQVRVSVTGFAPTAQEAAARERAVIVGLVALGVERTRMVRIEPDPQTQTSPLERLFGGEDRVVTEVLEIVDRPAESDRTASAPPNGGGTGGTGDTGDTGDTGGAGGTGGTGGGDDAGGGCSKGNGVAHGVCGTQPKK
jgi:uncharacterized membrane protein YgcG